MNKAVLHDHLDGGLRAKTAKELALMNITEFNNEFVWGLNKLYWGLIIALLAAIIYNGQYKNNDLVKEVTSFISKDKKRPLCTPSLKE